MKGNHPLHPLHHGIGPHLLCSHPSLHGNEVVHSYSVCLSGFFFIAFCVFFCSHSFSIDSPLFPGSTVLGKARNRRSVQPLVTSTRSSTTPSRWWLQTSCISFLCLHTQMTNKRQKYSRGKWELIFTGSISLLFDSGDPEQSRHALPSHKGWEGSSCPHYHTFLPLGDGLISQLLYF